MGSEFGGRSLKIRPHRTNSGIVDDDSGRRLQREVSAAGGVYRGALPLVVLHKYIFGFGFRAEQLPAEGHVVHALQAEPNRLRAGRIVPLPVHVAAQLRHHPHHLRKRRRCCRWRSATDDAVDRFPFRWLEDRFAANLGATAAQTANVQSPPGHDQIHRQARQQTVDVFEPPPLDPAARFQRPEKHLDHPPQARPSAG